MTTAEAGRPVDTGSLWRHLDRLTAPQRTRVVRTPERGPATVEWITVPPLHDLLAQAQASTSAGGGAGKASGGSRAPLNLEVTSLLADIAGTVVEACAGHDLPLRHQPGYGPAAGYGVRRLDVPANLRGLAAAVADTGDEDLVTWWTAQLRTWVTRAQTSLQLLDEDATVTRPVRGAACPDCDQTSVLEERDGETYRVPAVVVVLRDGQVLARSCRACDRAAADQVPDTAAGLVEDLVDGLVDQLEAKLVAELTVQDAVADVVADVVALLPAPRPAGDDLLELAG